MPTPDATSLIELPPGSLVIADLHLDAVGPGAESDSFRRFLASIRGAPCLLVLGDLFDAWIGPSQCELAAARRVVEALRERVAQGTRVECLVGNRDFLLERRFEAASGARVHRGGVSARIGGERVLFVHGDELCTLDHAYQRMKRVLRSAPMLWGVPRLPRFVALACARRLRRASVRAVAAKPPASKAQQTEEAVRLAREAGCATLVCGHAHEFRDEVAGGVRWIVLDAFGGPRDLLRVGASGALEVAASSDLSARP